MHHVELIMAQEHLAGVQDDFEYWYNQFLRNTDKFLTNTLWGKVKDLEEKEWRARIRFYTALHKFE